MPAVARARLKARQGSRTRTLGRTFRVVDFAMNDVPADGATMGEVVMRGNNVMLGYYRDPDVTHNAFSRKLVPLRRYRRRPSGWSRRDRRAG